MQTLAEFIEERDTAGLTVESLNQQLARLQVENAALLAEVRALQAANQGLWGQAMALGEAHATRNTGLRDHLAEQMAETWGMMQARAASGRIH
jgi:hypothetical protein